VENGRAEVLTELITIHRIDAIHSRSWLAHRLLLSISADLRIPWLIRLDGVIDVVEEHSAAYAEYGEPAMSVLHAATGCFYGNASDFKKLQNVGIRVQSGKNRWSIDGGSAFDHIATACTKILSRAV
jgi:hypothetical protein